jgi:hypothetical protein
MTATILQGSVFDMLPTIAKGSVDICITSPPYWMLRSYLAKDHPLKALELGSEPTPVEFVANMVRVFALVREAMAEHGTCWVNIGDSYSGSGKGGGGGSITERNGDGVLGTGARQGVSGIPAGNLALIPQRLAIALQDDGWLVRSVIIWHKPAPMPASLSGWAWKKCRVKVKEGGRGGNGKGRMMAEANDLHGFSCDTAPRAQWVDCPGCARCLPNGGLVLRRGSWRPTSSWEPILMLAKSPNYFADGEGVKTPAAAATVSRDKYTRVLDDPDEQFAVRHDHETLCESGANARDVQTWAAEPLKEAHYAAFPTALVRFCLLAGTSAKGNCAICGVPWCRVIEKPMVGSYHDHDADGVEYGLRQGRGGPKSEYEQGKTLGWRPSCACVTALPPRPPLVLDPFAGSGRTGLTAQRLGMDFVGIELNPDYADMSRRLLYADNPLFS